MTETARLRLPVLAAAQAQKHVTHNEALVALDTLVQASVIDKDLTAPPGAPAEGDCYIVAGGGGTATGAWTGWEKRLARYQDGQWISFLPGAGDGEGWLVWVMDEDAMYRFDGTDWDLAGIEGPEGPPGPQGQGIEPDATGTLAERDAYDDEPQGFVYLRTDVTPFELYVKASAASGDWAGPSSIGGEGAGGSHGVCEGRLTLVSGTPVMTSDQTAKTTVYFTPYKGSKIALYNGASWDVISFSEASASLSGLTANTNYDIFGYNNSGALALELVAWTNDTTRATALALQDGVYCKTGALTRRYLGTLRITGTTGQTQFSFGGLAAGGTEAKLFLWNMYNRVDVRALVRDSTDSYTYTTAAWRAANNSTAMRVSFVSGLAEDAFRAEYRGLAAANASGGNPHIGVGLDATNAFSGTTSMNGSTAQTAMAARHAATALGFHFVQAIEYANNGTYAQNFYGDLGLAFVQTGFWFDFRM
jgi:hypothetical protein